MEFFTLTTDRLLLKGLSPKLIHEIFNTHSKAEVMQLMGLAEGDYLHYLEMHEKGMETHRISLFVFMLVEKTTNRPIGECGFHTWNTKHRRAELFYLLRNDADKQKGYMKEALPHVIEYGFAQLGLHRMAAFIDEANTPSLKLLKHFGFTKEGTMREDYFVDGKNEDSDCYALLNWEWENFASNNQ